MKIPSTPEELEEFIKYYDQKKLIQKEKYKNNHKYVSPKFKKYNITPEEFDALYDKQQGRCAICNKTKEETLTPICIDHSNKTNKVRGLLCLTCNRGLGYFKDDINLLLNAIEYLKKTNT